VGSFVACQINSAEVVGVLQRALVEKKNSPARRFPSGRPVRVGERLNRAPSKDRSALEPNEKDSKGMTAQNRPSALPERLSGVLERARPLLRRAGRAWRPGWAAGALTVLLALSALLLAYSQSLDLFKIVSPEGVVLNAPRAVRDGIDQHGWALVILAIAAGAGGVLAWASGQPLPAWGAALVALIALVITLAFDLPDATSSGLTGSSKELGEAEPAAGLWVQLAASLALLATGTALALVVGRRKARSAERRATQREGAENQA
jgi:hypothetical protein